MNTTPRQGTSPLSIASDPETFSSIKGFLTALAQDNPDSKSSVFDFLVPEKLIAGGAGLRCRYAPKFGVGIADIIRPFAGAMFLLYSGQYDQPDLINQISRRSNRDDGRYMIRMVLEGDVAMRFGRDTHKIGRGEALMYRFPETADIDLLSQPSKPHRYVHMVFTEAGLANAAQLLRISVPMLFSEAGVLEGASEDQVRNIDEPALEHFAESLWLYNGPDHLHAKLLQLKVGELFCLLGNETDGKDKNVGVSLPRQEIAKLTQARMILDSSLNQPPTLTQLAADIGLNRRKLTEGFRALNGLSVGDYCRERRDFLAQKLLAEGALSISQIAEHCGYQHPANFSRAFSQRYGISPSVYRKNL
ncbi:MAG: AraC family transcriptional regulator [Parvibaculaceae bacterium]|nr:AraC family transcriptional regulator [Parvibaculaceae bacterium]